MIASLLAPFVSFIRVRPPAYSTKVVPVIIVPGIRIYSGNLFRVFFLSGSDNYFLKLTTIFIPQMSVRASLLIIA